MQHETPTTWIRALLVALIALIVLACALRFMMRLDPDEGWRRERTRTDSQTIRSSVELYLAQNPGGDCPSLSDLVSDHMLNGNTNTQDQWGTEFAIDCAGKDPVIVSAGPDCVLGNADDIR